MRPTRSASVSKLMTPGRRKMAGSVASKEPAPPQRVDDVPSMERRVRRVLQQRHQLRVDERGQLVALEELRERGDACARVFGEQVLYARLLDLRGHRDERGDRLRLVGLREGGEVAAQRLEEERGAEPLLTRRAVVAADVRVRLHALEEERRDRARAAAGGTVDQAPGLLNARDRAEVRGDALAVTTDGGADGRPAAVERLHVAVGVALGAETIALAIPVPAVLFTPVDARVERAGSDFPFERVGVRGARSPRAGSGSAAREEEEREETKSHGPR